MADPVVTREPLPSAVGVLLIVEYRVVTRGLSNADRGLTLIGGSSSSERSTLDMRTPRGSG
jgi:hypothetical protein